MSPLLRLDTVSAGYGPANVLFEVSLEVMPGECVCLLGRNGVGKTTTMRVVMGLTPPRSGRVLWKGENIAGRPPHQIARLGIGLVPEDRRIFPDLTVFENLDVAAKRGPTGAASWTIDRVLQLFPKLAELMDRKGGFLSGGEQQMLTITRTLMGNPELVMLDEPSEGLAPLIVEHLQTQIAKLKGIGTTILLAEQNLEFGLALADRVYILQKGEVVFRGKAKAVREDATLRQRFLTV